MSLNIIKAKTIRYEYHSLLNVTCLLIANNTRFNKINATINLLFVNKRYFSDKNTINTQARVYMTGGIIRLGYTNKV